MWNLTHENAARTTAAFVKTITLDARGGADLELMIEFDSVKKNCFLQVFRDGSEVSEPQFMTIEQGIAHITMEGTTDMDVLERFLDVA